MNAGIQFRQPDHQITKPAGWPSTTSDGVISIPRQTASAHGFEAVPFTSQHQTQPSTITTAIGPHCFLESMRMRMVTALEDPDQVAKTA